MREKTNKKARNTTLDVLKGICILFVLITHYDWTDKQRLDMYFPYWIRMAVPIFLIISGFLYARSYQSHGVDTFEKAFEKKALFKRLFRFVFPFVIAFGIEEIRRLTMGKPFEPFECLCRFLTGGCSPGSYYIPVMIQFVFYFPCIFFIIKKHGYKGFLICLGINALYELLQCAYQMNYPCYKMLIFRYTLVIAFGCYMALSDMKTHPLMLVLFEIVGIVYIYIFMYTDAKPYVTNHLPATSYIASMYCIPIIFFIIKKTNLHFFPIELLGRASFDIFLTQKVYYKYGKDFIYGFVGDSDLHRVLANIIVCIAAGLLFYLIESKLSKIILADVDKKFFDSDKPALAQT